MKIGFVGCGAIGSCYASYLSKLGEGSTFWFEIRDIVPPEKPEDEEIPDAEIRQL